MIHKMRQYHGSLQNSRILCVELFSAVESSLKFAGAVGGLFVEDLLAATPRDERGAMARKKLSIARRPFDGDLIT